MFLANGDDPGMFGCGSDYKCVVTVRATDSAGDATGGTEAGDPADATVTITLKNVDEKPKFDTGFKMRDVMEGMTPADEAIYAATDPDGLNVNLTLMGPDGAKFQLTSGTTGTTGSALSFRMKPDYEMPTDANEDNVYEVTVRASDGTMNADRMVMVTVMDDDEAPVILSLGLNVSGPSSAGYPENGTAAVGTYRAFGV